MDRSVLESDPHRVLEGMAIAAYAVGAQKGYIYVRAEYPLAVKRLKTAIRQAERLGLLGNNICGTRFSFHIEMRLGAGAFVCGEETALIASIEGKRGTPRPRPPYPARNRAVGLPDADQQRRDLRQHRADHPQRRRVVRRIGTEKSKGTKVFALAGRVNNTGLIEVPMGITLREIIFDIGGGIPDGKQVQGRADRRPFRRLHSRRSTSTCRSTTNRWRASRLDHGLGRHDRDGRDLLHGGCGQVLHGFCMTESCGKCIPCRVGT